MLAPCSVFDHILAADAVLATVYSATKHSLKEGQTAIVVADRMHH